MLALGVIEESNSAWCSPVTLVRKSNGKIRLCLDARRVNEVTIKDAYPLPLIDGLLGRLDQTKYISSLDLKDAFWQIPLEESSRDKTAFTVPGRPLYQFRVMPFGLCNAPQTMSRLMHKVIPYNLHDRIFVYLDDLLITSATLEEHFALLSLVAELLTKANLTINIEKSKFLLKEINYLGYLVGDGGLRTDPEKVKAISEFPTPTTVKQIRRFLGMSGWYRRFIYDYAGIATPLTNLLKKGMKLKWSEEAQISFDALKQALTTAPVLAHPNFNEPFYVQCDASSTGVGGVLFQVSSGVERPIAYVSQKLNAAQKNYSVTEQECYAAVLSIKKFRPYIEGHEFTVITDHASLQWLMSQKDLSGRLARWSLKLQAFKFTIHHRKGSQNVVPDTLSRVFGEEINAINTEPDLPYLDLQSPDFDDVEYVQRIQTIIANPAVTTNMRVQGKHLYILPNCTTQTLYSDVPSWKLFVPTPLIPELIRRFHDPPSSAHLGISKTLERLRRYYYWPQMFTIVSEYISKCKICKTSKAVNYSLQPPMGKSFEVSRPWQRLYADFLGPYPRSKNGNTCIFIVLDLYSRFVILRSFRQASASVVCKCLEDDVFNVFGVPESLLTDNGKQFESKCLNELLQKFGVTHIKTPKYSPQSNASERVNRSILSAVRSYIKDNHREWDCHLQQIAAALRNAVHSSTTFSPHFLVFGQHRISHGSEYSLLKKLNCDGDTSIIVNASDRVNSVQNSVLTHLKQAQERSANVYNLRSRAREVNVGQNVYVRNFSQSDAVKGFASKLAPKYIEGRIRAKKGNVAVEVEDPHGKLMGVYHLKDVISPKA